MSAVVKVSIQSAAESGSYSKLWLGHQMRQWAIVGQRMTEVLSIMLHAVATPRLLL